MKTNANVKTTSITQTANELLGKKETKFYYLIIETELGIKYINVGEKTHNEVKKLTENEPETKPMEKPMVNKK